MSGALEKMKYIYANRDAAARDWKARGGKVVGYICNSVPEEMIWASGMMPVRLSGTPGGETKDITEVFNVNKYTEGFVNTMLNDLMTGKYDYLDYLVMPHATRNTLMTQYSHLHIVKQLWPNTNQLPELHFIEEFQSWAHNSFEYHVEILKEFQAKLEEWNGRLISRRMLTEAIEMCNLSRTMLKQVAKLRDKMKISGTEALQIMGSSFFMDKDEHNRLLELFLRDADQRSVLTGKRVFLEGSPQDNLQFYTLVESCGAVIVNEDNCWGSRTIEDLVDIAHFTNPLEAIAYRYHYKAPCGYVFFPADARCNYCKKKVQEVSNDGVIFYILENDAHGLWDYVDQIRAFESQGCKTLTLKEQPYLMTNEAELREKVKAFVAGL